VYRYRGMITKTCCSTVTISLGGINVSHIAIEAHCMPFHLHHISRTVRIFRLKQSTHRMLNEPVFSVVVAELIVMMVIAGAALVICVTVVCTGCLCLRQ